MSARATNECAWCHATLPADEWFQCCSEKCADELSQYHLDEVADCDRKAEWEDDR